MVHASTPLCRAPHMGRRRYKGSPVIHASNPSVQGVQHEATPLLGFSCDTRFHPSVHHIEHEACADAFNRLLLCIFIRT